MCTVIPYVMCTVIPYVMCTAFPYVMCTFFSTPIFEYSIVVKHPTDHIRIHHECRGGIAKSVPRITKWHHEARRVMTNGDREGRIFLSHPHTNKGFIFLLTTKDSHLILVTHENGFYKILNSLGCDMFFIFPTGRYRTCMCRNILHGLKQLNS